MRCWSRPTASRSARRWLTSIEPTWGHGQRRIVEPARLLTASEVEARVWAALACSRCDHLSIPQELA
jgi:hypothetical protein